MMSSPRSTSPSSTVAHGRRTHRFDAVRARSRDKAHSRGHRRSHLQYHRARRPLSVWGECAAALVVSAVLAAFAVVFALDELELQARGATADATVLSVECCDEPAWGDVSFETSGPQVTANIQLPFGTAVGDRFRVLYDRSDPNRVRRDGAGAEAWEIFYVLLFLGFAAWPGGWAIYHWFDASPSKGRG
jgi:hypothetical protein